MWQHNFTIATVVKLLTKCLCSESSLHSLPSRSSWCPRPSKPAYYIVDCWILRVAKGLLSMYICIVHRREKKKLAKNVNAIPPLAAANPLRPVISTFLKKLWINFLSIFDVLSISSANLFMTRFESWILFFSTYQSIKTKKVFSTLKMFLFGQLKEKIIKWNA